MMNLEATEATHKVRLCRTFLFIFGIVAIIGPFATRPHRTFLATPSCPTISGRVVQLQSLRDVRAKPSLSAQVTGLLTAGSLAVMAAGAPALAADLQVKAITTRDGLVFERPLARDATPAALDAPVLLATNIPPADKTPERMPATSGWGTLALLSIAPTILGLILFRRNTSYSEVALAGAAVPSASFDPLGLSGSTALQMTGGLEGRSVEEEPSTAKPIATELEEDAVLFETGHSQLPGGPPKFYPQRWVQLAYVSLFAMISDWVCFSVAAAPESWYKAYGHEPSELVGLFLFTNVATCFLFTDLATYFGLRKVIVGAGALMAGGCLLRSGVPFAGDLPSYQQMQLGTVLVGFAQPFFQCAPPLLSATWFGPKERALATAIAINFNQIGIAAAFLLAGILVKTPEGFPFYFSIISALTIVIAIGSFFQFQNRPPTPPSMSAALREAAEDIDVDTKKFQLLFPGKAWGLMQQGSFRIPLAGFVASLGVTNVLSTFTDTSLRRAGFLDDLNIGLTGAAFQFAIVLGGIFLGGYVDRSKEFKSVTMLCLYISIVCSVILSVAFGNNMFIPEWAVFVALLGLGATLGSVQPINAELAVEATYPSDENAIEAIQQLGGNLFSAILVPICQYAAYYDLIVFGKADFRGDSLCILLLLLVTCVYYRTFNYPLLRMQLDTEEH